MAKTPQYAGLMAPGRRAIRTLVPGDLIRVSRSDSGKITLPVYTRHLNATAVVQSVDDDLAAVVPCLLITTDLGVCRGAATTAVTIAED